MKLSPSNVRSRLTLWYVVVLAALLVAYGAASLFFLFLSMREQVDHNLLEDMETVEGQIATEQDGSLTLRNFLGRPSESHPRGKRQGTTSPRSPSVFRMVYESDSQAAHTISTTP